MVPTSSPRSVEPGCTSGLHHCCGAITWTPRGCLGLGSCTPKCVAPSGAQWPGEVVHPAAAWATPTEGHEEWGPPESLLTAAYRFPGRAGCVWSCATGSLTGRVMAYPCSVRQEGVCLRGNWKSALCVPGHFGEVLCLLCEAASRWFWHWGHGVQMGASC